MKKIIISISIIVGLIITSLLIVLIIPKGKRIKLNSYMGNVTLDLGVQKVKNYKKSKLSGDNEIVTFSVSSANDFYNNVIKKNELYVDDLDFEVDNLFAFGFFYKDNEFFLYEIDNKNSVTIESSIGSFYDYYDDNKGFHQIYLPGPFQINMSYDRIEAEKEGFPFYSRLTREYITFEMIKKIISYVDKTYWEIVDNHIFVKGFRYAYDQGKIYYDKFLLNIYELEDKTVMVDNYEQDI